MHKIKSARQRDRTASYFHDVVTRRTFLKQGTAGIISLVAVGEVSKMFTLPDGTNVAPAKGVILADASLCSGCRICEAVCCSRNTSEGRNSTLLSRIILVKNYLTGVYQQKVCSQCSEPPCLEACPAEPRALYVDKKSGTFARVIDPDLCIGCEQCVEACGDVFDPPRSRYDVEEDVCFKCHLCQGDPQCVKFCPYGALQYKTSATGLKTGYPYVQGI
jgi:Fe-S-cluster-containing dehydrogenase component